MGRGFYGYFRSSVRRSKLYSEAFDMIKSHGDARVAAGRSATDLGPTIRGRETLHRPDRSSGESPGYFPRPANLEPMTAVQPLAGPVARAAAVLSLLLAPAAAQPARPRKPSLDDTIRANVYADNWFVLYVNGELVAVDSIAFLPHNVISVDILPKYPMTIAVMAKDNADPKTGMEYANTSVGDAGFILKFADGTVTDGSWKARCYSHGPVGGDTTNPRVENTPIPEDWFGVDFDDAGWKRAREYTEKDVGPKQPFYEADFAGARFIWSDDLKLDNTVIFRRRVEAPPDGKSRPDFTGLNDVVPEGGPRRPGGRPPRDRPPRGGQR
jgi:hypothetical protein